MSMKKVYSVFLLLTLGMFAASSHAVLLDFDSLPGTVAVAGPLIPSNVIDDEFSADGILFGKSGVSAGVGVLVSGSLSTSGTNSLGGLDMAGIFPGNAPGCCSGDIYFRFLGVTDFVSFVVGDAGGDIDTFEIRSYDIADVLIDIQNVEGAAFQSVSIAIAGIHRVEVDFDESNDFGYGLDDLQFNDVRTTAVPSPSVAVLMFAGLLSLGFSRRRNRR